MKKAKILIVFALFVFHSLNLNSISTKEIIKKINITNNQSIILIYQNLNGCSKCFYQPLQIINTHLKNFRDKFKVVMFIRCDRDIELAIYKKNFGWEGLVLRDDGSFKLNNGISEKTIITIINYKGDIVKNLEKFDKEDIDSLVNYFKK